MGVKRKICSFLTTLLVIATFIVLPSDGILVCPWCDNSMQPKLLDCMYTGMISDPALMMIPLPDIEDLKRNVASYSIARNYMFYDDKKVAVDNEFCGEIANIIKKNNLQNNHAIVNVMAELAGNCYSFVTGMDRNAIIQDVKALVQDVLKKDTNPLGKNLNPNPDSGMPYSTNGNQPSNFQNSQPFIQKPLNNAPFNSPAMSPVNYFGSPPPVNNVPSNPPASPLVNNFGNSPGVNNAPFIPAISQPVDSSGYPSFLNNAPSNPSGSPPGNSLSNPSPWNNDPNNSPGSLPLNSFNSPTFGNNAPNPPASQPFNPSNNSSLINNNSGTSGNWQSNDYGGRGPATLDLSKNPASPGDFSNSSLQNYEDSQGYKNSPDNAAPVSTASPNISSPSQDSKSIDSDSSQNTDQTPVSSSSKASEKKTAGNEQSDDEELPCDEKFKIALYDALLNDERFRTFFGKLPISDTKPEVPKIMKHAFKEYGIQQHYTEFSTFWRFESKTLNKESSVEDWAEVISKILKIIFSRNNLLKEDCEEAGKKMAGCILDTFPGDPAVSSTENANQNDGNSQTSTEPNTSEQKASPTYPATSTTAENNLNPDKSTDSGNLSEMMLSKFETKENLKKLHDAAKDCVTDSGFDFDKFLKTLTEVIDSIQTNHPDWSRDKCQKEAYSEAIVVLTDELQEKLKNNNNGAKLQSTASQPDSSVDASDSQSSNSGAQPVVPNNYNSPSDDSTFSGSGSNFMPANAPQPSQDVSNYEDGTGPGNIPPPQTQPSPGDNSGLIQPSNFEPGQVNPNYEDWTKAPSSQPAVQQYYPPGPPISMDTQPVPTNQNSGFQPSPNLSPDYGAMNSPNRNNQAPADNLGNNYGFNGGPSEAWPVGPNSNSQNSQPQLNQNYGYGFPAPGPY